MYEDLNNIQIYIMTVCHVIQIRKIKTFSIFDTFSRSNNKSKNIVEGIQKKRKYIFFFNQLFIAPSKGKFPQYDIQPTKQK